MNADARKPLWRSTAWWIAAAVAARNLNGQRQVRRTLAWADRPAPTGDRRSAFPLVLHVVIPVLREQQQIPAALSWFVPLLRNFPGSTLTMVTTAREEAERQHLAAKLAGATAADLTVERFPQLTDDELAALGKALPGTIDGSLTGALAAEVLSSFPTTAEVVTAELARLPEPHRMVRHVHYRGDGRKAAQVNAAVDQLSTAGADQEYIAVYDVDSRPSRELLDRTADFLAHRQANDGGLPCVVQQSARFATQNTAGTWWERSLCRGAARAQTLWTLRREIPNLRRYADAARRPHATPRLPGLAQTVGHGLLVRMDVFRQVGGLPTFTVLDDVAFGYRLTVDGIPVDSLPFTTTVPAAEYLRELLAQSERWFQSYLDYPQCAARWHAEGHGSSRDHAAALTIGAYRGMAWLLVSPATAGCLALALGPRTRLPTRAAAATALWAATVAPVRALAAAEGRHLTVRETAVRSAETLAGLLLKSAGPLTALGRWAVTGTRHAALAPKSNRRTAPSTTTDREFA
ncbi:glycosyltransferase family 2 protein [Streptomyces kaniharaensis]|uniref:glycosyltransferase family 2 protein n=1 Tax=Streptomyces kaniharaensis TaxID=212423 RepID=UPI0018A81F50|nr:glycosyltransferase family 2 protein [Streptomyces kaniharaensis]